MIVTDAFSHYPYIARVSSTTAEVTVRKLIEIFGIEGLPRTIVTDNGTQFTSTVFKTFCERNGIIHLTSAPFHPQSNGEAERLVRTFKEKLRKILLAESSKDCALELFLSTYRTTPINGKSPAERLHGRQPRTLLQLFKPEQYRASYKHQTKFEVKEKVYVRVFGQKKTWVPAVIVKQKGARMYIVETERGRCTRHQNQITRRWNATGSEMNHGTYVTGPQDGRSVESTPAPVTREQPAPIDLELPPLPEVDDITSEGRPMSILDQLISPRLHEDDIPMAENTTNGNLDSNLPDIEMLPAEAELEEAEMLPPPEDKKEPSPPVWESRRLGKMKKKHKRAAPYVSS